MLEIFFVKNIVRFSQMDEEGNSPNGCQFNEVVCIRYGGALSHNSANKQWFSGDEPGFNQLFR